MTQQEIIAAIGEPRVRNLDGWSGNDLPRVRTRNKWVYLDTWPAPLSPIDQQAAEKLFGAQYGTAGSHYYGWNRVVLTFHASKLVKIAVSHGISY